MHIGSKLMAAIRLLNNYDFARKKMWVCIRLIGSNTHKTKLHLLKKMLGTSSLSRPSCKKTHDIQYNIE